MYAAPRGGDKQGTRQQKIIKRIIKALKDEYHYDKPKSGTDITDRVGIDTLRTKCLHFNEWLTKLEQLK